jgi:uncharacterized protein (UPF0335 family)
MARRPNGSPPGKRASVRKLNAERKGPTKKASDYNPLRNSPDPALQKVTERLVKLTQERKDLGADISELYGQAKDRGFDTKVLRRTVKILAESAEQRSERIRVEDEADEMLARLGALSDTPLGRAAVIASQGASPVPEPSGADA